MLITLELDQKWLCISCDGELVRKLHLSITGSKPQLPRQTASLEELQQTINQLERKGARQFALKKVAAQAVLSHQLDEALKQRGVSSLVVREILIDFESHGYLNDAEWIASFIRIQKQKRMGAQVIAQKLRMKGVAEEQYKHLLEDDNPQERIQELLASKYAKRNLKDFKERQKVIASLARKGYAFEDILESLRNLDS